MSFNTKYGGARDYLQAHADGSDGFSFIGTMIFPLTLDEAQARWALYNPELDFPFDHLPEHFGCRHWDPASRRCTEYAARPWMCSAYPYVTPGVCEFCGYAEPTAWWVWDTTERAWEQTRQALAKHGPDWAPPEDGTYAAFTWDGKYLRPRQLGGTP